MAPAFSRARRLATAILLAVSASSCNDFLSVENPGAVEETDLADPYYVNLLTQGVVGEFQPMFTWTSLYNALYSDEIRNHHVFFEERLIDRRDVAPENGTYAAFYYPTLQRSRFMADSVASRLKTLLGDTASRDVRLARVLAYGGYNHIILAENLCAIPIQLSAPYTSAQVFGFAIQRFVEAISVAASARAYNAAISPATTASTRAVAAADSITNFARVGAARAYLNINNKTQAIAFASLVTSPFEWRSYYLESSSATDVRQINQFYGRFSTGSSGSNSASINNTPFLAMAGDPRVPRPATMERMQDGTDAFNPNSPTAFSTYNGTATGADFTRGASVRVASYLEAQYIIAEANGPTAATLAFVNTRRAVGLQAPVTLAGDALMAELRDQRRRDLYMDNHRLGDLRRYKDFYNVDDFQKGAYPGSTSGEQYTNQYAWPLPLAEVNGNPNIGAANAPTCGR